jgi:hypothetical protein
MKSRFALVIIVVTVITMYSNRFNRAIITRHAQLRMVERGISDTDLFDIVETGSTKFRDENHLWVYKLIANRSDNLI